MNMLRRQLLVLALILIGMSACSRNEAPIVSEAIKQEIEEYVSGLACISTRAFPHEETSGSSCYECKKLIEAGLVEKEVISGDEGFSTSSNSIRYYLTDYGESAYVPGTETFGPEGPQFCFGNPRLAKITGTYGPVMLGGEKHFGISILVQLDDPNPYLFDSRANKLGIKLPDPGMVGKPVYYPELNVTAIFNPNNPNDFYLDPSMSIGPIGSLK
ncbi:MAG: hypothetical protein KJ795_10610 [Gammaproteobacteria bacterium]|nr:hypothetical protein [Gammaproteobacteria bacterium]MBU1969225.1 hypothetical protein [Gammaproteobacteria bacterium]